MNTTPQTIINSLKQYSISLILAFLGEQHLKRKLFLTVLTAKLVEANAIVKECKDVGLRSILIAEIAHVETLCSLLGPAPSLGAAEAPWNTYARACLVHEIVQNRRLDGYYTGRLRRHINSVIALCNAVNSLGDSQVLFLPPDAVPQLMFDHGVDKQRNYTFQYERRPFVHRGDFRVPASALLGTIDDSFDLKMRIRELRHYIEAGDAAIAPVAYETRTGTLMPGYFSVWLVGKEHIE